LTSSEHGRAKREARSHEDLELLDRYRRHGDLAARDRLVERMLPLVRRLALRYQRGTEPLEDLVQVGCVGLVKAIDRFDAERGSPFVRFAVPNILGEIRRHFRDTGWAAHVPRGMQERVLDLRQAMEDLAGTLGRSPTPPEVAGELGIDVEEVLEAMEAATAYTAVSLDAPRPGEDDEQIAYVDSLGQRDDGYALVEDLSTVLPALRVLPAREREIIRLRFGEDMTQSEIAERLGISQMHVSRLLRRALERVRTVAVSDPRSPQGDAG
jgi:RNA polymerase sigma-B factor